MKVNEIAIKRVTEAEETIFGTDGKGFGPTGYGGQDEGFGMALANSVATGAAVKILKKILIAKVPSRSFAFIPGFGLAVGLYFAGKSLMKGDWVGAGIEAGIGAAGGSVIANTGVVAGIAFLVYRDFYSQVGNQYSDDGKMTLIKRGPFPSEDWWDDSTPSEAMVAKADQTHGAFGMVLSATKDFIIDYLKGSSEFETYIKNVANNAKSSKPADPKKDASLNDIFTLAFGG